VYNANIQYVLNLGRDHQCMTTRTIEHYQKTDWGKFKNFRQSMLPIFVGGINGWENPSR